MSFGRAITIGCRQNLFIEANATMYVTVLM
jgi:hypothetical protein